MSFAQIFCAERGETPVAAATSMSDCGVTARVRYCRMSRDDGVRTGEEDLETDIGNDLS